jgi:hypothetical protein
MGTIADDVRVDGDTITGILSEEEWDIANEHASYLHACLDASSEHQVFPYHQTEYLRAALAGIAFSHAAEILYEDDEWEWQCDFRENPRVDPMDSTNSLKPRFPDFSVSSFDISGTTTKVSLFPDADLNHCSSPMLTLINNRLSNADVHVTGSVDSAGTFFSFYGAKTSGIARQELPTYERGDELTARELSESMSLGEPLQNQFKLEDIKHL